VSALACAPRALLLIRPPNSGVMPHNMREPNLAASYHPSSPLILYSAMNPDCPRRSALVANMVPGNPNARQALNGDGSWRAPTQDWLLRTAFALSKNTIGVFLTNPEKFNVLVLQGAGAHALLQKEVSTRHKNLKLFKLPDNAIAFTKVKPSDTQFYLTAKWGIFCVVGKAHFQFVSIVSSLGSTLAGPHSRHNGGPGNALLVVTNTVDYFLRLRGLTPLNHEKNHMMALAQAKSSRAMADLQDAITVRRVGGDDWMGPAQKGGAAMSTLYARAKDALRRAVEACPSDDVLWEEAHRLQAAMQNHNDGTVKGGLAAGALMKTLYQRAFDAVAAAAAEPWSLVLKRVAAALTGAVERHHAGCLAGGEAMRTLRSRLAEAEEAYRAHPSNEVLKTAVETLREAVRNHQAGSVKGGEAMKTLYARAKEAILAASAGNS